MSSEKTDAREMMAAAKFYESYSRYNKESGGYESWDTAVDRVMDMHKERYRDKCNNNKLKEFFQNATDSYKRKEVLGAQRALQFGGEQLLAKNGKMYNCTASYLDRSNFFKEALWLMLCGCGVGFSVQSHHIAKLPSIGRRENELEEFVVGDSIEGWSDAVGALMSSFFQEDSEYRGKKLFFDTSKIRPKGAYISGGFKAPGPKALDKALESIKNIIEREIENGATRLKSIVAYDIVMFIADAVISGGVRRSATICMFSHDDEDMINAKTGNWWIDNPQRGRSNNSVMLLRNTSQYKHFKSIMETIKESGDPGFIFTDDTEMLLNPCAEIGMYAYDEYGNSGWQVCNLSEINGAKSDTPQKFYEQCKSAAVLGTLQAGYTDFSYLGSVTERIVEREALIGVSITGWMNNPDVLFDKEVQRNGAKIVKETNKEVAEIISINQAARTTCVKPSGNASVLLSCGSGIHGEHSKQYIRHVQMNKTSEVAQLFMKNNPDMVEESIWSDTDIVISFPVTPNSGSMFKKDLLGTKQLEFVKNAQMNWVESGTNNELCVKPYLKHNVSNTITVDDWDKVGDYIYNNRQYLCGVSLLAEAGDKAYAQAPFTEVITEKEIVDKYGVEAMFASGLIEAGLKAFDGNLWNATNTALGFGETLTEDSVDLLKRDFVRRFNKFSDKFPSKDECSNCLKDVYNLHKWWRITNNIIDIEWGKDLGEKEYVEVDTLASEACSRGNCEMSF